MLRQAKINIWNWHLKAILCFKSFFGKKHSKPFTVSICGRNFLSPPKALTFLTFPPVQSYFRIFNITINRSTSCYFCFKYEGIRRCFISIWLITQSVNGAQFLNITCFSPNGAQNGCKVEFFKFCEKLYCGAFLIFFVWLNSSIKS